MLRRPRTLFGTQVVYDASPLVRSELAVALARLVRGHMPLLEDAIMALRVRGVRGGERVERTKLADKHKNPALCLRLALMLILICPQLVVRQLAQALPACCSLSKP